MEKWVVIMPWKLVTSDCSWSLRLSVWSRGLKQWTCWAGLGLQVEYIGQFYLQLSDTTSVYMNRMGNCSMVMQALVDHQGHFTNTAIGWWGERGWLIFRSIGLFQKRYIHIHGGEIPIGHLGTYPSICCLGLWSYTLDTWTRARTGESRQVLNDCFVNWWWLWIRLDLSNSQILHNIFAAKKTFLAGWQVKMDKLLGFRFSFFVLFLT